MCLAPSDELQQRRQPDYGQVAGGSARCDFRGIVFVALGDPGRRPLPARDDVISAAGEPRTRLRLAPEDARFLEQALDRLPGAEEYNSPVTVDLNGRVAVRARAEGQPAHGADPVPLRLHRPVRAFNTNRAFLARALHLGFAEIQVFGAADPLYCREGQRSYLWQPLAGSRRSSRPRTRSASSPSRPTPRAPPVGPSQAHATRDEPAARARPAAAPEGPGPRGGPAHGNGVGGGIGIAHAEGAVNGKGNGVAHGNGSNGNGMAHGSGATGLSAPDPGGRGLHRDAGRRPARHRRLLGGLRRRASRRGLMTQHPGDAPEHQLPAPGRHRVGQPEPRPSRSSAESLFHHHPGLPREDDPMPLRLNVGVSRKIGLPEYLLRRGELQHRSRTRRRPASGTTSTACTPRSAGRSSRPAGGQ